MSAAAVEAAAGIPAKVAAALAMERLPPARRAAWVAERLARQTGGRPLSALPICEREHLRASPRAAAEPVVERRTSGSTGRPVRVVHGAATVGWAAAARLRQLTWFGLEPTLHPQLDLPLAAPPDGAPIARAGHRTRVDPFQLGPGSIARVHAELVAGGGVTLVGATTSVLARFAALVTGAGLDGRALGARLAIVGGELTDPADKAAIAAALGCPAVELYGSGECGILAAECPAGGLHVAEEAVHVEVVDDAGRPLPAGERGWLLVSLLHNDPQPLLRYRVGDTGALAAGSCPCGRTLARLELGVARREELVHAPDGRRLHPRFLRTLFEEELGPSLRGFRTVQHGPAAFAVHLDLAGPPPAGLAAALAAGIGRRLGARPRLELVLGPLAPEPGKARTFSRAARS